MYRGSIHDFPDFDPNQDAEALYTAMKGFGGCRPPKSGSHGEEGAWKVTSTLCMWPALEPSVSIL